MKSNRLFAAIFAASLVVSVGCGKGSNKNVKIEGVDGPKVGFLDNKFTMAVVLTEVDASNIGGRVPIPHMPNSYVEVGPDFQSNGLLIAAGLDVNDLVALSKGGAALLDPLTLPGGRALPGIAEGFLPGVAVEVPSWNHLAFYVGADLFGVFVPVNLPWKNYMASYRFYDGTGERVGNISVIGKDNDDKNSGLLLMIGMKGSKVQTIMKAATLK